MSGNAALGFLFLDGPAEECAFGARVIITFFPGGFEGIATDRFIDPALEPCFQKTDHAIMLAGMECQNGDATFRFKTDGQVPQELFER